MAARAEPELELEEDELLDELELDEELPLELEELELDEEDLDELELDEELLGLEEEELLDELLAELELDDEELLGEEPDEDELEGEELDDCVGPLGASTLLQAPSIPVPASATLPQRILRSSRRSSRCVAASLGSGDSFSVTFTSLESLGKKQVPCLQAGLLTATGCAPVRRGRASAPPSQSGGSAPPS